MRTWKFKVATLGGGIGGTYLAVVSSHGHHPGHPFF